MTLSKQATLYMGRSIIPYAYSVKRKKLGLSFAFLNSLSRSSVIWRKKKKKDVILFLPGRKSQIMTYEETEMPVIALSLQDLTV